ncbi:MAG: BrnT family toxin [Devosia sp.]
MEFDGFEWDDGNWPKCGAHGVSIEEVEELFLSADVTIGPDRAHSETEARFAAIGPSHLTGRTMLVIFTVRDRQGQRLLRPISARFMHEKEIRRYERTRP